MPSVAVIGPDGAGKTTLTRRLEASGLLPFKYLYMGINTSSSNVALPTSRLVEQLKPYLRPEPSRRSDGTRALPDHGRGAASEKPPGRLWVAARLANRIGEQLFRQLVSWWYQLRGYTVLYDRHFLFDFSDAVVAGKPPRDRRFHIWFLKVLYPRPSLVIFLDAPGEVLFERKGESTARELERRRQALLQTGKGMHDFIRVDATRPLDEVYEELAAHVVQFCRGEGDRALGKVVS